MYTWTQRALPIGTAYCLSKHCFIAFCTKLIGDKYIWNLVYGPKSWPREHAMQWRHYGRYRCFSG